MLAREYGYPIYVLQERWHFNDETSIHTKEGNNGNFKRES